MLEPTVIGSWSKEGELGSGGFGVVSLWTNHSTKEYLALKKCNRICASEVSQKQGDRWKLEVKTMQELDHENIVQFRKLPPILENELAKYNPSGLPILSMEYCPMGNLRNALMKPQNSCGFSEAEVIDILSDTSRALQYLHEKNITHRDFKPENIVLQPSASRVNGVMYKIIDLGYAKELDSGTVSFVGTLQYLAPEIFQYQHYSHSVDYWSFGVTAFEVICGIRPFLPTLPPMASFQHIRNKKVDIISIQITRTGDIDFSNKLFEENWLTWCLSAKMTKWLKSVLQYKPEYRGSMEEGVFDCLKTILSTRLITVFCVYTYEFYSYEITETTQFGTLLESICNDIQLNPNDFYIVPTKTVKNAFAMDFYDEINREAMLFIFNKRTGFEKNIRLTIPSIIKVIMANMKVELNESTSRQIYAQTNYFVLKEEKYLKKLKDSICFFSDFIKNKFEIKTKYFTEIKNFLKSYLSEIEFYDQIDNSFAEIYKTKSNAKSNQLQQNYKQGISELNDIIKVVNDLLLKDKNVFVEFHAIEKLANDLIDHLGSYNFDELKLKASKLLETFYEDPTNHKTASPITLTIITKTIKIRNELMNDASLANFLSCASKYCEELSEFIATVRDSNIKLGRIKEKLRKVKIDELNIYPELNSTTKPIEQIIKENDDLQQKIEEVLYNASADIKNVIREVNIELDSMMQLEYSETIVKPPNK